MPSCIGGKSRSEAYQVGIWSCYEEKPVTVLEVKERVTRNWGLFATIVSIVSIMQRGKGRIICETLILLSMLNETLSKSQDGIFIRERAVTPQCYACIISLALHDHKHHSSMHGQYTWNIVMKHTGKTCETHLWNIWNIHMKHGNTYMGLTHVR
jgi:hypothetical protein